MVFVRQNQGRTISIPTLDAQSQDGFSTILTLDAQSQDGFYAICSIPGWGFVKNQPKNPGWTFITFSCVRYLYPLSAAYFVCTSSDLQLVHNWSGRASVHRMPGTIIHVYTHVHAMWPRSHHVAVTTFVFIFM